MSSSPVTIADHEPWRHVSFLKDSKLRARERYWHTADSTVSTQQPAIVPDAQSWRVYLRLLQKLASLGTVHRRLVLLESVAELLDHRNQSPVLGHCPEAAAAQERATMMRLVERQTMDVFCDLSVRDLDFDEWQVMRGANMSMDERSRLALSRAARLLGAPSVWLLVSDDETFRELSGVQLDDEVQVLHINDVLQRLQDENMLDSVEHDKLLELAAICDDDYRRRNATDHAAVGDVEAELSVDEIQLGLREKRLFRGRLQVSSENVREAHVKIDQQTYFVAKSHTGHAFHSDMVIVQPLPESEWGRPIGRHRIVNHRDTDDADEDENVALDFPTVPSVRVVAIDQPSRRTFVATLIDTPKESDSHILVVPRDMRIPKIRVQARSWHSYVEKRLKIEVDGWESGSNYPFGRCTEIMGGIGDLETEIKVLLHENQVELEPFSASAMACLPVTGADWTIDDAEIKQRLDLRESRKIFSVDPPGCQDIDDSMHAFDLPNGDVEVGVHIADVTHFVQHNSRLDLEAQERGTTFYLVDRRFDMLPSLLSSNLCSLHGQTDRLAVSVIWTFSNDLRVLKSCWFGRTVIRNCAAMTYDQADNILQSRSPDTPGSVLPPPLTAGSPVDARLVPELKKALNTLTALARLKREEREAIGGAVDLSSGDLGTELKFTLDENGQPTKVVPKADKEIHHTIAELMILANTFVAKKIYDGFPDAALLRIHQSVEEDRFGDLRKALEAGGLSFEAKDNMALAQTLKMANASASSSAVSALFQSLATRALSEAQYVCTGDIRSGGFAHYGLGLDLYTHFTSPIRRYADVVVHKQLLASLANDLRPHTKKEVQWLRHNAEVAPLPASDVVSILRGEGLETDDDVDSLLSSMIEGASALALGSDGNESPARQDECVDIRPYKTADVSRICDGLNLHNRLAKYSSTECQRLFLSMYFRDNAERTKAVVIDLRANGFWVYVPRFDMKVPVYLKDATEQIQIDPRLVGLPPAAGEDPTHGFVGSICRRFATGRCDMVTGADESLEVKVPGAPKAFKLKRLDVVTIELKCDNWDLRARVPPPRAQLLAENDMTTSNRHQPQEQIRVGSTRLATAGNLQPTKLNSVREDNIFETTSSFRITPEVPGQNRLSRKAPHDRQVGLFGRIVYGGFVNPDTRSAAQEVAQQNAAAEAAQRRAQVLEQAARRNEFNETRRIEGIATDRQQRLAAAKRNARRSKGP